MAAQGGSGGFFVDLDLLAQTMTDVRAEKDAINTSLAGVRTTANGLAGSWKSPAHGSYDEVQRWFDTTSADLMRLLDDILVRMRASYDNYKDAEGTNVQNMTPR